MRRSRRKIKLTPTRKRRNRRGRGAGDTALDRNERASGVFCDREQGERRVGNTDGYGWVRMGTETERKARFCATTHTKDNGARDANVRDDAKNNAAIAAAGQGARSSLRGSRGEEPPGGARRSGDLRARKRARSGGVKCYTKPPIRNAHTPLVAKAVLWKTAARSRAEEVASDKKSSVGSLPNLQNSAYNRKLAENGQVR